MKFLSDFFPVLLFFVTYVISKDILLATKAMMIASVVFTGYAWFRQRKLETMQWVSFGLSMSLGGAALLFNNERIVMWKPTVLYWTVGTGLLIGELAGKNGIRALMGQQMELPAAVWRKLSYAWVAFFALMGALNLFVAYHFSKDTWVNFKMFGGLGLMFAFVIAQSLFLSKYLEEKK